MGDRLGDKNKSVVLIGLLEFFFAVRFRWMDVLWWMWDAKVYDVIGENVKWKIH